MFYIRNFKKLSEVIKAIVFGLLKRGDKVYTEITLDCKSATLQRIIKGKIGI